MENSFTYCGVKIVCAPMHPKYVLPQNVPPPTGMTRDEFHEWSKKFCGEYCMIPDDQMIRASFSDSIWDFMYVVSPKTYLRIQQSAKNLNQIKL